MDKYRIQLESKQHLSHKTFLNVLNFISKNAALDELKDLLLKYLENFPQQISVVSETFFIHLMSASDKKLHPLVLFLASHGKIDCHLEFNKLPVENWAYLMSAFYQRHPQLMCDPVFVTNAIKRINVLKVLTDSPKWFIDNVDFFIGLHLLEFDEIKCEKLFTELKANWSLFVLTEEATCFVDLIAIKCNKEIEFNQYLITALFSLNPENADVTWLSCHVIENLKDLENNCPLIINDWDALIIKSIKCGLIETNPVYGFLKVLTKLIKKVDVDKLIVSKCFQLLVGHSQFTSIMLSRDDAKQSQKEEVLKIIETLVKKEPSIMALSHVPLYLCSYNASLSVIDQLLLKILFHYEENAIPMSNYRPYLWGSFAVSHYHVTNHLISKTLSSFPSTTEVLSYIPLKRLKETISFFPVDRKLHIKDQKIVNYECYSKDSSKMFDPAFFLPMMSSLLATEAPLSIEKFNRSGCLSMVLACLGSCDAPMRTAAYHILTLLRSHLFCKRAENIFWDYFLSWVARGVQDMHSKPPPQLSMIQASFLSKMALSIANHDKGIESICCKLLLARPAARLNHIPELKTFLVSPNSDFKSRDKTLLMRWFFVIVRDGLRTKNDWLVLKSMDLLNIVLVIFNSSNEKERILILEVMENIFRIEPATQGGCGTWALSLMVTISKDSKKLTVNEISVLYRCLQSLSNSSYISIPLMDFLLYLFMEYGNDHNICREAFVTFNKIVSKNRDAFKDLSKENLFQLMSYGICSNVLTEDEIFKCRSVLEYGIEGFQINDASSYVFLPTMIKIFEAKL